MIKIIHLNILIMKIKLLIIILTGFVSSITYAQTDTINPFYKDLDTLIFYRVSLSSETKNSVVKYSVNGISASKKKYMRFKKGYEDLRKCYLSLY